MSLFLRRAAVLRGCSQRFYATKNAPSQNKEGGAAPPKSCCPADTVLPGINYLKNHDPVVALPDEDYPDWLWTVLSPKVISEDTEAGKIRKRRLDERRASKQRIKERNFMLTQ